MNEEWLSAHLDGELSPSEQHELEAALAADPAMREVHDDLARVRAVLRSANVDVPPGALPRIMAAVEAADATEGADATDSEESAAAVVALPARRRVPTFAAVAAAAVIITGVVGGLGGSTTVPALGELIAQHEVAAAVIDGEPMPDDADLATMGDMDPMPMDDASAAALPMPADYSMEHAYRDDHTVHLVYRDRDGEPLSVFRHEGEVDTSRLGEGSMVSSDEADMWSAPVDGNHVAVVDGTGYVWIVVSAAPHDDLMDDLMHDLPTRTPSLGERLRDAADAVVEPFRIWD